MGVPKYCRHKGTNQAYSKFEGKWYYFGIWDTEESRKAYREFLEQLELSGRLETNPAHRMRKTVHEVWEAYKIHTRREREEKGIDCEPYQVDQAVKPLADMFGHDLMATITPRKIKRVLDRMIGLKLARSTINMRLARIKRFFRFAASEEFISGAVFHAVQCVEPIDRRRLPDLPDVEPVTWEDAKKVFPWVSPVVADIATIQFFCAMRPGEACALTPSQVDRTGDVWLIRPLSHKTAHKGKNLVKAVPKVVQPVLAKYLEGDPDQPCFRPEEQKHGRAGRFDTNIYYHQILRGFERAEEEGESVPRWSPMQLRHGIATELARLIGDEKTARYLGHSGTDLVPVYAKRTEEELVEIAGQLNELLGKFYP